MMPKPQALSGGEQQRVAIARALMNDPMVVLADEPTGNLDANLADETMRLFRKIRERGTTIIIASHNLDLGQRYGTRVISLQEGCLVDDLSPLKEGRRRVKAITGWVWLADACAAGSGLGFGRMC